MTVEQTITGFRFKIDLFSNLKIKGTAIRQTSTALG